MYYEYLIIRIVGSDILFLISLFIDNDLAFYNSRGLVICLKIQQHHPLISNFFIKKVAKNLFKALINLN